MTKIVLVGAGSLQFGAGMLGDIFTSSTLKDAHIVLNDINGPAAERTLKVAQDYIDSNNLTQTVSAESDLRKGLVDATFVVISIEVGDRFALWDMDWHIPQQYGIPQVYGENGGPGGLFHSLRIIPPVLDIVGKVMEVAPNATIFNFSNPMSRICTTVHRAYPESKFIGVCHEVKSLDEHLPGILNMNREDFHYRAGGLNHFSVLSSLVSTKDGSDLMAQALDGAKVYFQNQPGYSDILTYTRETGKIVDTEGWHSKKLKNLTPSRPWSDRWLFKEVLEKFGAMPITYDSHFGEYIHWAHEVSDHQGILDFYTLYRNFLGDIEPRITTDLNERVVPMIEGILNNETYEEYAVNIPNAGYIKGLPDWICVEVPAYVNINGLTGIPIELPAGIRGLLCNQIGIHDMTAEAILTKKKEAVLQALMVDPIVPTTQRLPAMVEHFIQKQSPWLDYLK